ncbi:Transketolase [Rhodovastum atsumiense]|uniref:Transketolase n=2 Tax=Rhodovastum atsumiense TaxID=504468 RepID=A0A5M6J566_9PROT|nr:transketolase [Rhodovastum atsumiense]CAH2599927.1 Transketolase [Rhodovastum atsumiense]
MEAGLPVDWLCINTIRTLAMDAVQKAKSGHPGTPMALAPVAYTLWQGVLRYDPAHPSWPDRDRFVLSVGHASMLLYALLHLTGVRDGEAGGEAVSLDDIKAFRQLGSRTPGHPEYRLTAGVETTTGPLGQGVANSVGMAMAQRWLAARYNRPGFSLFDHRVWAMCGDGDMMEGVSNEAASLAGHLRLSNLTWIYDSNAITIEGATSLTFSDDVGRRFEAYGWAVRQVADANDTAAVADALQTRADDRPTLILVRSIIGYGAPHRQGTREAHGEPLGEEEVRLAKHAYGWPEDAHFLVPEAVRAHFAAGVGRRGARLHAEWEDLRQRYRAAHPDLSQELDLMERGDLPEGWDADIPVFPADANGVASRDSSQKVLNAIAPRLPWLLGGAADLAPSTKSNLTFAGAGSFAADNPGGRNLHFGIREHAMGSIANGLALAWLRPYASGFLIFSDYMRPPIRLSSIMELPVIYIFTHDSIGVGEDGPTHQPVEQLASLRAIPGLLVIRPADANEVAEAWRIAVTHKSRPTCLVLSRQNLPTLDRATLTPASGLARGAYVLAEADGGAPEVILIASGSEVSLALAARERLAAEGVRTRVVSMPSWELFEEQPETYRAQVLPPDIPGRVAIEQAAVLGWDRYVGSAGTIIGMRSFGASAPLAVLQDKFGFTPERVAEEGRRQAALTRAAGKEALP